ncbi:MAG: hypothetical protein Q7R85_02295 [bacterium]|nr:hypothetical protein [bacterium]
MRKRDVFVFLLGVAATALVGWIGVYAFGLISLEPRVASMTHDMDSGRCVVVVGYGTGMESESQKREGGWHLISWTNSGKRLEQGGSEEYAYIVNNKEDAIAYRDRLLKGLHGP